MTNSSGQLRKESFNMKSLRFLLSLLWFGVIQKLSMCNGGVSTVAMHRELRSNRPRECPTAESVQSDYVKTTFEDSDMVGFFYELAFKDVTQPRYCSCQTINRTYSATENLLNDIFSIQCFGKTYFADLSFEVDPDEPGTSVATWNFPILRRIKFPNIIVDVKLDDNGEVAWIIELQCIPTNPVLRRKRIRFYAMNFYSRTYTENNELQIAEMDAAARERGLGPYLDSGFPMHVVNHTDCLYGH